MIVLVCDGTHRGRDGGCECNARGNGLHVDYWFRFEAVQLRRYRGLFKTCSGGMLRRNVILHGRGSSCFL
jgi:hypothetical protein